MRSRLLLSNLSSLVLALFLGVVIWVVAVNTENPLRTEENFPNNGIPIELENVPDGVVPLTGSGENVFLRIRAPEDVWPQIEPNRFRAWADLQNLGPGLHDVPVQVEQAQPADERITILRHTPQTISVRLDEIARRDIQVQVDVVDRATLPTSYQILTPTVDPPTVTVRGPSTRLEQIDRAVAEVQAGGSRASIQVESQIQLLNVDGDVIPTGQATTDVQIIPTDMVQVQLPIQPRQGYRELIVQPVVIGEPARGYWISDIESSPRTISVVGLPASVAALSSTVQTEPIDVSGLQAGELTRRVRVQLPDDVSPLEGDRLVSVTVAIEALKSSKRISVKPEVSGLQAGLAVEQVSPETIDVLVEGPVSELEQLTPEDVVVVLDLTNLREGMHLVEPRITPPGSLVATSSIPNQVEVTIGVAETTREISRPVVPVGVPSNLRAIVDPETVSVTLQGPSIDLETVNVETISATVDIDGRGPGTYTLTPTVTTTANISATQVTPQQVQVTVEPASSVFEITRRLEWRGLGSGLVLNLAPPTVTLTIRGPGGTETARDNLLNSPEFQTTVNVSDLEAGQYTLTPEVSLPADYQLLNVVPEGITARVTER